MPKPAVICVDGCPVSLKRLQSELKKILRDDYRIIAAKSATATLAQLSTLEQRGSAVVLVFAEAGLTEMPGAELLARIHQVSPQTLTILTGQPELAAIDWALREANLYRLLPDPWQPPALEQLVTEGIQSYLQAREAELKMAQLEEINQDQSRLLKLEIQTRELAKLAQQTSETELNDILDSLFAAVARMRVFADMSWQVDYRSAGYEQLFGYSAVEMAADNTLWKSRLPDEDLQLYLDQLQADLRAGCTGTVEFRFLRRDGSLRWIAETYTSYWDPKGNCWSVTTVDVDVSDRKQIEANLRRNEEQLRLLADSLPVYIAYADVEQRYQFVNKSYETEFGTNRQEICGRQMREMLGEVNYALSRPNIERVLAGETPRYQVTVPDPQGERHLSVVMVPDLDPQSQVRGFYTLAMDISDLKRAEISLREEFDRSMLLAKTIFRIRASLSSSEILNLTVQEIQHFLRVDRVVIYQFDSDWAGRVIAEAVVAPWKTMLGEYIHDSYLVHCIDGLLAGAIHATPDILVAELADCHLDLLLKFQVRANLVVPIHSDQQLFGLLVAQHCQGPRNWETQEVSLMQDMADQLAIALQQANLFERLQQELAERQATQTALVVSEAKFRNLVENANDIIFQLDLQGHFSYISPSFERLLGYPVSDLPGLTFCKIVHAPDLLIWSEVCTKLLQGKELPDRIEYRVYHQQGHLCWHSASLSPLHGPQGEVMDLVVIAKDISDRKAMETATQLNTLRLSTLIKSLQAGVLLEDETRHIVLVNQVFCDLFKIPVSPPDLLGADCSESAQQSKALFAHPDQFVAEVEKILRQQQPVVAEELDLADGRTFERDYVPIFGNQIYLGHLWLYRDVSNIYNELRLRKQAELHLQQALQEKTILLQEVHHRVKNNLQVISSLLKLQARRISDPLVQQTLEESQNRVMVMALVHQHLYQGDSLAQVNLRGYIHTLTSQLFQYTNSAEGKVNLVAKVDPTVSLSLDQAVPCGLIINELITNGFKHGLNRGQQSGTISVIVTQDPNQRITLMVENQGNPLPPDFDLNHPRTMGLKLVNVLSEQLKATLTWNSGFSTRFYLSFDRLS
jgi:PAS domain S-box-containing protein